MRRCRIKLPNRCYHLISRVAHRAYFLDEDERTQLVDFVRRVAEFSGVKLLAYSVMESKSPAYLRTTLGIASREYFTKAYLRPLIETGLIERSDPVHPNSPQQKYALTKDGRRRIERVAPL